MEHFHKTLKLYIYIYFLNITILYSNVLELKSAHNNHPKAGVNRKPHDELKFIKINHSMSHDK